MMKSFMAVGGWDGWLPDAAQPGNEKNRERQAGPAGAPREPEIRPLDRYAAVRNDPGAEQRVVAAFTRHFPGRVRETLPTSASEDFRCFGAAWHVPSVFGFVGGIDPAWFDRAQKSGRLGEIPTNHNPRFAPVIHPTLETGVETLVVAARAWLAA